MDLREIVHDELAIGFQRISLVFSYFDIDLCCLERQISRTVRIFFWNVTIISRSIIGVPSAQKGERKRWISECNLELLIINPGPPPPLNRGGCTTLAKPLPQMDLHLRPGPPVPQPWSPLSIF